MEKLRDVLERHCGKADKDNSDYYCSVYYYRIRDAVFKLTLNEVRSVVFITVRSTESTLDMHFAELFKAKDLCDLFKLLHKLPKYEYELC